VQIVVARVSARHASCSVGAARRAFARNPPIPSKWPIWREIASLFAIMNRHTIV
jgi:hypothetical protein